MANWLRPAASAFGRSSRAAFARPSRAALAADAVLAAALTVAVVIDGAMHYQYVDPGSAPESLVLLGLAFTAAPLAVRRRYPIVAFLIVAVATIASNAYVDTLTFALIIFAAYCAVAYSAFHICAIAAPVAVGVIVTLAFANTTPPLPGRYTALLTLIPTAALGNAMYQWRRRVRDSALRLHEAQAEHEAVTARALAAERARIASELHDVVTHNVSVMVVQTGAARRILESAPAQAREALLAAEASGRTAMSELRHLLGLLAPGDQDVLHPQPGLSQLGSLLARVRAAGLEVSLSVTGTSRDLPPGLDLAAYRVVQEALTNVLKHASQARTTVLIDYQPEHVLIEVTDAGPAFSASRAAGSAPDGRSGSAGTGRGLVGLRERIEIYRGSFEAGPRPAGGWRVRGRLPCQPAPADQPFPSSYPSSADGYPSSADGYPFPADLP